MRITITLAVGLTLTVITVCLVLQRRPAIVAETNGVRPVAQLSVIKNAGRVCQAGESLPPRVSAIRLSLGATVGPAVAVAVVSDNRVLTGGAVGSGWYGSTVTVPVRPLLSAHPNVTICAHLGSSAGGVGVLGVPGVTAATAGSGSVPGRLSVAYLRPGARSWWSLAGSVSDHMMRGRAVGGVWVICVIAALVAAVVALASLAVTRELR